jgi:hypothetical protein
MVRKIHMPHLKTAQDARAVRTREALRRALLRLLDLKSLEQITIRDICEVADVGYTTSSVIIQRKSPCSMMSLRNRLDGWSDWRFAQRTHPIRGQPR